MRRRLPLYGVVYPTVWLFHFLNARALGPLRRIQAVAFFSDSFLVRRPSPYLSAVLITLLHLIRSASSAVFSFRFCFFRLRAVATSLSWRFFCSIGLFGVRSSGMPFSPEEGCSVSLSVLPCLDGCSKACSLSTGVLLYCWVFIEAGLGSAFTPTL